MKRVISIFATGLAVLMVSCQKENNILNGPLNQITDLYTVPSGATALSELTDAQATWSVDRRYFDLTFGTALSTTLVGYDALLTPGQYILGGDEIGKAILAKTKVNGETPTEGFITVNNGVDGYAITAHIDGQVFAWKGALPFVPDPDPVKFTVINQAQSYASMGYKQLNLTLATAEGLANNWGTWAGEGKLLSLDLYTADAYLHEGSYKPCATAGTIGEGEFGIGYEGQWGMSGSYIATVAEGAATFQLLTEGTVKVSSREEGDAVIWTINWGVEYPVEILFEGEIPALTKPKTVPDFDYTFTRGDLSDCVLNDNTTVVEGVKKNPITIVDADGKFVAQLEFVLAEGVTDLEGTFVSTEYAHEVGQLANGFDLGAMWGAPGTMIIGSYLKDGETITLIEPGQSLQVKKLADDAYEFIGEGFDIMASGPDYVPGSYKPEGGDSGPVYDMTDTVATDCTDSNNTLYENVESHTLVLKDGEDFVAQIKLVRATGTTNLAGSYTVGEYAHEDFIAANGFDLGALWGSPGTMVIGSYYMKEGAIVLLEPGETITVTATAANTYKFEGSTGYAFVGKLQ